MHSKFGIKAKGNVSHMYVSEAERNEPQSILEKLGRGKVNPDQIFVWVQEDKGHQSYMYVGAVRLSEMSPNQFWRNKAVRK